MPATLATADQIQKFNNRIAAGKTGENYLTKNNIYVGSNKDNATLASQKQLEEYYNLVRSGKGGQNYLNKNNIYIGNRGTPTSTVTTSTTTATTDPNTGMNQSYYDMVYGYETPKLVDNYSTAYQDSMNKIAYNPSTITDSWSNNYQKALDKIDYGKTTQLNDDYYNDYKKSLSGINGLANVDTLYDWRKQEAADAANSYMAALGLSGSSSGAKALTDAVNKVTAEDAMRYENLYMQEAQRQTDAAKQLADAGYNLENANASQRNQIYLQQLQNQFQGATNLGNWAQDTAVRNAANKQAMDTLRIQNEAQTASDLAKMANQGAINTQNLEASRLGNSASNYRQDTLNNSTRLDTASQNKIRNLLDELQILMQGNNMSNDMTKTIASLVNALGSMR